MSFSPSRRDWLASCAGTGLAFVAPGVLAGGLETLAPQTHLPPWQALDLSGRSVPVPAPGKPTIVNFWASWCEPCRTEMPLLQQMADFYSDRMVLQAVNFKERPATVQRHVKAAGWVVPVLLDPFGQGAALWGVKVFPTTIGFDAQGRPRWRVVGEHDWSSQEAGRLVETLWR